MTPLPPLPAEIAATLPPYPEAARRAFDAIRKAAHVAAAETGTGPLTECLKWGEPAWLTAHSRSGTTIRLAWKPAFADEIGLFFNCRTTLVETMRQLYPDSFRFDGNRALYMSLAAALPDQAIDHGLRLALTYHRNKRR